MYQCKDWERTKQRFRAFWEHDMIDRAVVFLAAPADGRPFVRAMPEPGSENLFYTDALQVLERNIQKFENTYYTGDGFASIWVPFAAAGHCCYVKNCKFEYGERTVWVHPTIQDWEKDRIVFDKNNEVFLHHCDMLRALCARSNGRYLVGNLDNGGNIDALASLRGSSELLMDFMAEQEMIQRATDDLAAIQRYTTDRLYEILYPANNGTVNAWMGVFCEQKQIQIQCDLSVMISPEMFEEFVLPDFSRYREWPDRTIYHLDGQEQIRHLDMILSSDAIDAIQWTPVEGQPRTSDFLPELARIQAAGKSLVLFPQADEVERLASELSHKGLFMNVTGVRNPEQAEELLKIVSKQAHE